MADPVQPVDVVVVTVVGDDRDVLGAIAGAAIDARLAACGQVGGPVTSVYRWEGAAETAEEWTLTLKTAADRTDELVALVVDRHPYDVPEVLVAPLAGGHAPYLDWVRAETRPAR
ncbi:divalent-cation tolerance protein CutA [Patulibacter minatonensis]|uniref:divalent-cation tolerance protein CutA n=1 Tax=Patulibacter minatonensis TaxID=298163 RepID=UPI00047CF37B|nr:divalent-cation tolerance protein CutA [Patulibacter minatonensis]